jgi:O-antigen/teichoic acid export membrane protein
MSEQVTNSYRSIIKATGVFGMMQVIRLIISVVSSKFVAIFLGPVGIGLVSLFTNALNIVLAITNFEFLKTATREIALSHDSNNSSSVSKTITVLQKMAIVIGLLGGVIVVLFSRTLSYYTFGNYDRQHWFILLSIYLFISSYSNVRMAILQGVNNIKKIAWCNIVIAFFTSIGSIIIYYFFKIEGIIWVLLYSSLVMLIVTIYFTRKFSFSFLPLNLKEFYTFSNPIFKLGFFLSLNLIFGQLCNFIIKLYLNNNGASAQVVGLYEVSSVILINYLGLIFNAMSYDFYPKLTALSSDNLKVKQLVNHQIEIALIIVTPAIIFLYLTAPFLIELLYSVAFSSAFLILKIALFSVIIKAIIMPLSYTILAKGNRTQYFKQELLGDFLNVSLSILFYNYFGLVGLGLAYVVNYTIYSCYVYYIVNKEYSFTFIKECSRLIVANLFFGIVALFLIINFKSYYLYIFLILLFLVSSLYSIIELNKRMNLKDILTRKRN